MEVQKLRHFADGYRFVFEFFEHFHFTGGILYKRPRSTKQRTIGSLLTTLEIGPWIRLSPRRHAQGYGGRYDPSFLVIMDHPTGYFARLGLEPMEARETRGARK